MKITKGMVIPIIAVLAFFIQTVFHINISDAVQSQIADIIVNGALLVSAIVGIVKNLVKEEKAVK